MGKRKIKLLMLGLMDRIEQINAILVEKNKYKNIQLTRKNCKS